jgi:L-lactate dehydrogenase complex protein LldE
MPIPATASTPLALNDHQKRDVTLFVPCLVDGLYPEVGEAVVALLQGQGVTLTYPVDQTCCGQPAFSAGYRTAATAAARRFIRIFGAATVIVSPSGSCVNMVRNHYTELFADDPHWHSRAQQTAGRTFEFSEYLVDVLGLDDLGARFDGRITYHDSCHLLRRLGIAAQPRKLLSRVRGATFVEMKDADCCCGFGGSFALKYADISAAMTRDKVTHILATGADAVVGCDVGCLMNIQGLLSRMQAPVKTLHIAQLLAGKKYH